MQYVPHNIYVAHHSSSHLPSLDPADPPCSRRLFGFSVGTCNSQVLETGKRHSTSHHGHRLIICQLCQVPSTCLAHYLAHYRLKTEKFNFSKPWFHDQHDRHRCFKTLNATVDAHINCLPSSSCRVIGMSFRGFTHARLFETAKLWHLMILSIILCAKLLLHVLWPCLL